MIQLVKTFYYKFLNFIKRKNSIYIFTMNIDKDTLKIFGDKVNVSEIISKAFSMYLHVHTAHQNNKYVITNGYIFTQADPGETVILPPTNIKTMNDLKAISNNNIPHTLH